MFGIGGGELIVVALVAILLFGNEELPKNMRKIVKAWNDFRGMSNDLQRSWMEVRDQVTRDIMSEDHHPPSPPSQSSTELGAAAQGALKEGEPGPHDEQSEHHQSPESQADEPQLPVIQPAAGALAQGELSNEAHPETIQPIVPSESDKST